MLEILPLELAGNSPLECWRKLASLAPVSLAESCCSTQWLEAPYGICLPQTLQITLDLLDHNSHVVEQLALQSKFAA